METPSLPPSDPRGTSSGAPEVTIQNAVPESVTVELKQPGTYFGRFGRYLLIALGIAVAMLISQNARYQSYFDSPSQRIQERFHSGSRTATDKVAVLTVSGGILSPDGFIKRQIDRIKEDQQVKAVVLRINSTGGSVTASDYLFHHLKQLQNGDARELPMVVSMGSLCASGGYYLAMAVGDQEEVIFAEPASWTGSIGVIIPHFDFSRLLQDWKIRDDSIASHQLKQLGSPTRLLSDEERAEERAILQGLVDESFAGFKQVVQYGRPRFRDDPAALDKVATGQIFTSAQAEQNGLIDRVGFIEAAIDRAIELAGLDADEVRVVKYKKTPGVLDSLLEANSPNGGLLGGRMESLLDLSAPRAYYLYSWLPSLLTNTHP